MRPSPGENCTPRDTLNWDQRRCRGSVGGGVVSTLNAEVPVELGYLMNDADQHSTPARDAYERFIDPDKKEMAIRTVQNPDGSWDQTYNGRPRKWRAKNFQVVGS